MVKKEIPAWSSVLWLRKARLTLNVELGVSLSFMCTEGQRDFPHSRDRKFRNKPANTEPACWHPLPVGALEPGAASDQPEMVSSRINATLKLCRLSVSFTRIILTCFNSHILSPHFLFSRNKMVSEVLRAGVVLKIPQPASKYHYS